MQRTAIDAFMAAQRGDHHAGGMTSESIEGTRRFRLQWLCQLQWLLQQQGLFQLQGLHLVTATTSRSARAGEAGENCRGELLRLQTQRLLQCSRNSPARRTTEWLQLSH